MSDAVKTWWAGRTLREQRMLLVMFALMAVVAGWLIVIGMDNALSDARARHARAVIEHAEVAGKVEALKGLRRDGARPPEAPVDIVVSQAASEIGLVLSKAEAQSGNRVGISVASARPQAFFGWINDLDARGVVPETLTVRANSDQTLSVEAVLRGKGL